VREYRTQGSVRGRSGNWLSYLVGPDEMPLSSGLSIINFSAAEVRRLNMSEIETKVIEAFGDVIQEEDLYLSSNLVTDQDCQDCD